MRVQITSRVRFVRSEDPIGTFSPLKLDVTRDYPIRLPPSLSEQGTLMGTHEPALALPGVPFLFFG
jgi:hypothetical protein